MKRLFGLANAAETTPLTIPAIPTAAQRVEHVQEAITRRHRRRDNEHDTGEQLMPDTVPLALLAIELGTDVNALAAHFADTVRTDDNGLRAVTSALARAHIAAHHAAAQRVREQAAAQLAAAAAAGNPTREKIRALRARQTPVGAPGEPLQPGAALAVLQAGDGTLDEHLDASARQFDELVTGRTTYHRISPERQ
jgi:hypothetical protein